jgi:hypothetical protein
MLDPVPADPVQRLHQRIAAIGESLAARDDALALLALGSIGRETDRLDAWSDLDFFAIVATGAKAGYLSADLAWLAAAHPIAWAFRNTADGYKVLMADGVFCEFAVFEPAELARVPYAAGRWVWRRDTVDETWSAPTVPLPVPGGRDWRVGEALSNLIIGLQRHARGETLAAMRMVQVYAVDRVLELLDEAHRAEAGPGGVARDPFSVDRRVEQRLGSRVGALPEWTPGYGGTCSAALALLRALEDLAEVPAPVADRIRTLAENKGSGSRR